MRLRIALSGSAGTGKTTLARALAARLGLPLIPEAMRAHLEAGRPRPDSLAPERARALLESFRRELLEAERRHGAFVADNGELDLAAYGHWYGCPPDPEPWEHRYDAVVLLPAGVLPYVRDGVRRDDPEEERRFQALLEGLARTSRLGWRLIRIPPEPRDLEDRFAWVMARLRACTAPSPADG